MFCVIEITRSINHHGRMITVDWLLKIISLIIDGITTLKYLSKCSKVVRSIRADFFCDLRDRAIVWS